MLVLGAGFAALLAGTGLYIDRQLEERVTEEFDAALLSSAESIAGLIELEPRGVAFDYTEGTMPQFEREDAPDYFQIALPDGTVLDRSPSLGTDLPLAPAPGPAPSYATNDLTLPDGRAGRAVQLTFVPTREVDDDTGNEEPVPDVGPLVILVARGRGRLDGLVERIRLTLLGFGGVAALLAVALVWRSLATGLRPLDEIAAQVRTLDATRLSARLRLARTPRELAPVIAQLNALLARLEESFARERRFTANAAHELRTPIAELRSLAEVAAKWPDDADAVGEFFGDVRDIATRMERLVLDLLLLARCQSGIEATHLRPVRVREVVEAAWSKVAAAATARGLRWHLDLPADLTIETDPDKLAIVVGNLLENAASYALPEGEIGCTGAAEGPRFRLEFTNPAPAFKSEDIARLADAFWRGDDARSSDQHAGLGLSLVTAVARLLGLDAAFRQDPDGTFRAVLTGPRSATREPQPAGGHGP